MALANALIAGSQADAYAADKPTWLPLRAMGTTTAKWTDDGASGSTDKTDTSYPYTAAQDGLLTEVTRPNAAQQVWWYRAPLSATLTVDAIFLYCLTMAGSSGSTPTVKIYVSDDSTDTEVSNVDSDLFQTAKRMGMPCLQVSGDTGTQAREFTGATCVKVRFDAGTGKTCRPQLAEVVAGQQCQMYTRPAYPVGELDREAIVDRGETLGGAVRLVKRSSGRQRINARWTLASSAEATRISTASKAMDEGARPLVWMPNPQTAPNTAYLMVSGGEALTISRVGPGAYEWMINATEQGGALVVDE